MQLSSVLAAALLVASCDALICKKWEASDSGATQRTDKTCAAGVTKCIQAYYPNYKACHMCPEGPAVLELCGTCNRPL